MHQISAGAFGSQCRIRFHRLQAHAWTAVTIAGLLGGFAETAVALSPAQPDPRLLSPNARSQPDLIAESRLPSVSSDSLLPGSEAPAPNLYSESYWTALADLDVTELRGVARNEMEVGFAQGMTLLTAGEHERAESAFVVLGKQLTDLNVAAASQVMLASTLLYQNKWSTLRDLASRSGPELGNRQDVAELARWGRAFSGLDPRSVSFPEKPLSLRLKTTVLGTPTIRVRINGKDYDFWVDTGSSITVLSSNVAAEANVPILTADTLTIRTFAGHAQAKPAFVSRMEIGAIVFTNSPAIVMEASLMRLKASGDGIPLGGLAVDGIIGWDTIRQLDMLMDYDRGTITIQRPESLGTRGTESQNLIWVGKPFVELRMKNGATLHFTLDTGAQSSFLNASILEKADAMTSITAAHVYGLARTGREAGRVIPSLTVTIGGKSVRLQRVIVYGPSYSGIVNCDGILGSDIAQFGRIRIDATNGIFAIDA